MKVKKQELLSQLNNAQNNFMLGISGLGLLMQVESYPILESLICVLTDNSFSFLSSFYQINELFQNTHFPAKVMPLALSETANYIRTADEKHRQNIQEEFFKMLLRVLLKETFEVIADYCNKSEQRQLLREQDWYDFARILRNCLSHNFFVEYKNEKDKKLLPIAWRERCFTADMEGKPLHTSFLGIDGSLELYKVMKEFVEKLL